jgi:hypothetical protein
VKVAIIGSGDHLDDGPKREGFVDAARGIGEVIGQRGHELVVGSSGEHSADLYAVQAANSIAGEQTKGKIKVTVFRPEGSEGNVPFKDAKLDNVVLKRRNVDGVENVRRAFQLGYADVAVAIGGEDATLQIGMSSPALQTPLLAVPSFEGASRQIFETLTPDYKSGGISENQLGLVSDPWDAENSPSIVMNNAEHLVRNNPYRKGRLARVGRAIQNFFTALGLVLGLAMVVALIAAWGSMFLETPGSSYLNRNAVVLLLLLISSALGVSARQVLSYLFDRRG